MTTAPSPRWTDDAEIDALLARLDREAARIQDRGHRAAFLNSQDSEWERRSDRLLAWAESGANTWPPNHPMSSLMQIDRVRAHLQRRIAELRNAILHTITEHDVA